jgi:hypothetical protein
MATSTRLLRKTLENGYVAIGTVLVLTGALLADDTASRTGLTLIGLAMLITTILDRHGRLLPGERRFEALRAEVDAFLAAVRRLNAAVTAGADPEALSTGREELLRRAESIGAMVGSEAAVPRTEVPAGS